MQPLTSLFSAGKSVSFSCFEIEDWKASSPPPPAVPPCITPAGPELEGGEGGFREFRSGLDAGPELDEEKKHRPSEWSAEMLQNLKRNETASGTGDGVGL
ncbi:hypothetical protein Peur_032471 [Populus x canadensis]